MKLNFAALLNRGATTETPSGTHSEGSIALPLNPAAAELETRFREAIASGKITGDIISLDEQGNVIQSTKSTNIFDV